jgi:hypothetical protein
MQDETSSNRCRIEKLFYWAMVVIGIYATIRYGGEWAYALGNLSAGTRDRFPSSRAMSAPRC